MEESVLKQIAFLLIQNLNDIGKSIKELEVDFRVDNSKLGTVDKIKNLISDFTNVVKICEGNFVLPEKIIDNIFLLFIKFLDLSFYNSRVDLNYLSHYFIPVVINFLNIEQNFMNLNMTKIEFLNKKWKFIEKIVIFILSLIDKYDKNSNKSSLYDLQSSIKIIFSFIDSIYFSIYNAEKYKIMPGVISKIIKIISFDLKLTSKILKISIKIFAENVKIIFEIIKNDLNFPTIINFQKHFITFLDFYNAFHIMIKEKLNKNKINKIIDDLIDMNLKLVEYITLNIQKLLNMEILQKDFEEIIYLRNQNIFYFLSDYILKNIKFSNNFFTTCAEIFKDSDQLHQKTCQIIKNISVAIDKEEFSKINSNLGGLYLSLNLNVTKNNFKFSSSNNISNEIIKLLEIDIDSSNNLSSLNKVLLDNFYNNILIKMIKIKENLMFEIINTYELQIKNVSKEFCFYNCEYLLLKCIRNENELELNLLKKILTSLYMNNIDIYLYYFQSNIINLSLSVKIFRQMIHSDVKIKQVQLNFDEVLNSFIQFIFISIMTIQNELVIVNSEWIYKSYNIIKQYVSFFTNFLVDNQDTLSTIKDNKIILFNSLLLQVHAYLMSINKKIYNKNERNGVLVMALNSYSNKTEILKMSSLLLLHELGSQDKKFELKKFVISNFDFIINTTINRIIYFSSTGKLKKNQDISKFKIDVLNLFNSLILLLKEIDDDNSRNFYSGEFNKFITKLFSYLDLFYKEKNFINLECLLEIIERVTNFQKEVIDKNYSIFKLNNYETTVINHIEGDSDLFVQYLTDKCGIHDTNIFRNLILRVLPLIISGKPSIIYKSLKIFSNLISTLIILPMTREEKINFSTEDNANVLVRSSLGPIMFESWEYFLYILKIHNPTRSSSGAISIHNIQLLIDLLTQVSNNYSKFFTESRLFSDLLPLITENIKILSKQYSFDQIHSIYSKFIDFLWITCTNKFTIKIKSEGTRIFNDDNQTALVVFLECYLMTGGNNIKIEERNKVMNLLDILMFINRKN